jgi:hypothetical protein
MTREECIVAMVEGEIIRQFRQLRESREIRELSSTGFKPVAPELRPGVGNVFLNVTPTA